MITLRNGKIKGAIAVIRYICLYPRIIIGLFRLDEQSLHQCFITYHWRRN